MAKHLNRKVGEMEYDRLIAGITPPVHVGSGTIRKLVAEAEYKRGTVLAKSSVDNKLVILGTAAADEVSAVVQTYKKTTDDAIVAGKKYFTRTGGGEPYTYTLVDNPKIDNIGDYYEIDTPGADAIPAEILVPDCVLTDDTVIGNTNDVVTTVYTAGCFNVEALIVKTGYTISEADKDKLRERGLYLGVALD